MACIDKYPDTTSDKYKKCIEESSNNYFINRAKQSNELTVEQQGIKDEYFEAIKITDEDEKNIIKDLRNSKKQKFKSAKYKQEGFGTMAGGPKRVLRSEQELEDLLGSDYELYKQYLGTEDDEFLDNIKLKEEDISAERSSRIKMKSRTYMEGVKDKDRLKLLQKFGEDYESSRKKIDTANFLVDKANENAEIEAV